MNPADQALEQAYATVLSLWNVAAGVQTARLVSRHLNLVTFAIFASYVYRDVWPLMTFTLRPIDEAEGNILWVQVALSCFVGVIEPLFEPRAWIPIEPEVIVAVLQTFESLLTAYNNRTLRPFLALNKLLPSPRCSHSRSLIR